MTRRLFLTVRSPFARKVHLLLLEKALPFEAVFIDLAARTPEFIALSPLGKVPLLQDEDGTLVFDSSVIAEYLEDRYPQPPMLGISVQERLLHRELDELGDTAAEHAVTLFYGPSKAHQATLDKAAQQLDKSLQEISRRIERGQVPRDFGLGQAAVLSATGYIALRLGKKPLDAHPAIERWLLAFADRASVRLAPAPTE